jgi:hypothetical protein
MKQLVPIALKSIPRVVAAAGEHVQTRFWEFSATSATRTRAAPMAVRLPSFSRMVRAGLGSVKRLHTGIEIEAMAAAIA